MSASIEHYRAQAARCRELAASAQNQTLAKEWLCLGNLWLGMVSKRMEAEASLDLLTEFEGPPGDSSGLSYERGSSRSF